MTDHLDEPRELSEQRLMNEGADAARRLGEAARAAVAAVRLLQDSAVTLMLRQAALDYYERATTGDLAARRFNVREHLARPCLGRRPGAAGALSRVQNVGSSAKSRLSRKAT